MWVPTPPIGEKNGRKRSLQVDGNGVPLSLVVSGANRHDVKLLGPTLDAGVMHRPAPDEKNPQNLCLDAAYTGDLALAEVLMHDYNPHIRSRGEEIVAKRKRRGKPRRWVVERCLSWLNRFRKLLVSFEKTEESYIALLSLAAALICWRQTIFIYG